MCVSEISEDLFYLLSEMCVFPKSVADRILYYAHSSSPLASSDVKKFVMDLFVTHVPLRLQSEISLTHW